MIARRMPGISLRLGRPEMTRLAWLIVLSALLHALVWGGYEIGKKLDLWDSLHWPAWLQELSQKLHKKPAPVQPVEQQPPLMFVDVSQDQATPEPPKDAKYYSAKNSQATNPDTAKDTDTPKIDGSQEHVAKTEDSNRHMADQLQPSPAKTAQDESPPQAKTPPGDLAMAKPDLNPQPETGQAQQPPRPRTLAEAQARLKSSQIPGQKMKQDAGVRRRNEIASLDAMATPFGEYDRAFIDAVQSRWDDLLDARNYAGYQQGRVVVRFHLRYDGTITDMEVLESNVDTINSYLCQKAVTDPAPYEKWPSDMRREIGDDYRTLTFTFYYN
jgi:outer membrane biosynthesis protein TonB